MDTNTSLKSYTTRKVDQLFCAHLRYRVLGKKNTPRRDKFLFVSEYNPKRAKMKNSDIMIMVL